MNNILILVLINLTVYRDEKSKLELENAQLEINNLIAQQDRLKQQIHPHFLFNALSNLQSLITLDPHQAKDYTTRLANFLRSSLNMTTQNTQTIQLELETLQSYLELQSMRFPNAINCEINLSEKINNEGMLPVFSLQFLAENAIKHNAFSARNPLFIEIYSDDSHSISFKNNLLPKITEVETIGIGLKNLSKRYELLGAPALEIKESDLHFLIRLPLISP